MSIKDLYENFSIPYWTEGKNVSKGWINTTCPWCDDTSNHLGFNGKTFHCWRCGTHSTIPTIAKILGISEQRAFKLAKEYEIFSNEFDKPTETKINLHRKIKLPTNLLHTLPTLHRKYLENRGFDPDKIQRIWDIQATGPISSLDEIQYKYRIFIPIYWNGRLVSFQTRDVTGKHHLRYMACPKRYELIHHKEILYCKQEELTNKVILVEGVFDVWKLGVRSAATFGTGFTQYQLRVLAKFDQVFIVFDPEDTAQELAEKLKYELQFRGVKNVEIIRNIGADDPANLTDSQARYLVKQLLE